MKYAIVLITLTLPSIVFAAESSCREELKTIRSTVASLNAQTDQIINDLAAGKISVEDHNVVSAQLDLLSRNRVRLRDRRMEIISSGCQ